MRLGTTLWALRPRVLYLLAGYPNFSETYMHEEMRSVRSAYDVRIVTYAVSGRPRRDAFPYEVIEYEDACPVYRPIEDVNRAFDNPAQRRFLGAVGDVISEFRPDVLHCHYLGLALLVDEVSRRHGIPYTVRTHSQDILAEPPEKLAALCEVANGERCLRVLAFPAFRRRLIEAGLDGDKVVACWPLINHARFDKPDRRAPTYRVLCAGPATRKKAHKEFLALAARMDGFEFTFDLYARGPSLEGTVARNESLGSPARISYADPDDMPDVYPNYDWLVYPASVEYPKVGFPVSIAEAQACGLGICWQELPGRREEQLEFLGGAGFLFESIDEVPGILARPYPEEMRLQGLENAKKCDVDGHINLLTDVWDEAALRRRGVPAAR